jgi:hypothetical protein
MAPTHPLPTAMTPDCWVAAFVLLAGTGSGTDRAIDTPQSWHRVQLSDNVCFFVNLTSVKRCFNIPDPNLASLAWPAPRI